MKRLPAEYDALVAVALDARDALRNAIPRLDAALAGKADPIEAIRLARDLAAAHSSRLQRTIKRPIRPAARDYGNGPCWGTAQ